MGARPRRVLSALTRSNTCRAAVAAGSTGSGGSRRCALTNPPIRAGASIEGWAAWTTSGTTRAEEARIIRSAQAGRRNRGMSSVSHRPQRWWNPHTLSPEVVAVAAPPDACRWTSPPVAWHAAGRDGATDRAASVPVRGGALLRRGGHDRRTLATRAGLPVGRRGDRRRRRFDRWHAGPGPFGRRRPTGDRRAAAEHGQGSRTAHGFHPRRVRVRDRAGRGSRVRPR